MEEALNTDKKLDMYFLGNWLIVHLVARQAQMRIWKKQVRDGGRG